MKNMESTYFYIEILIFKRYFQMFEFIRIQTRLERRLAHAIITTHVIFSSLTTTKPYTVWSTLRWLPVCLYACVYNRWKSRLINLRPVIYYVLSLAWFPEVSQPFLHPIRWCSECSSLCGWVCWTWLFVRGTWAEYVWVAVEVGGSWVEWRGGWVGVGEEGVIF